MGRASEEMLCRQPDSGKPTVRDEKGGLRKRELKLGELCVYEQDCARRISIPTSPGCIQWDAEVTSGCMVQSPVPSRVKSKDNVTERQSFRQKIMSLNATHSVKR